MPKDDPRRSRGVDATSASVGLIQASIQAVDGSSAVYYGGSVAYNTKRSKPVLLNDAALHASLQTSAKDADAYRKSKLDWTSKTALAYLDAMGTDFAVAEGGAAGPSFRPAGLEAGFSAIAVAARGADGAPEVVRSTLVESTHGRREANMDLFATAAARELLAAATADEGVTGAEVDSGRVDAVADRISTFDVTHLLVRAGLDRRSQDRDDEAAIAACRD